jgi:hypothetical protein
MEKHFIDPKRSEILSVFLIFPCMTQIAPFWPKLLPALYLISLGDITALLESECMQGLSFWSHYLLWLPLKCIRKVSV